MIKKYASRYFAFPLFSLTSFLLLLLLGFMPSAHAQCVDMTNCTLIFSDEFDGTTLDLSKWTPLVGDGTAQGIPGWGNNELQYYQPDNATVSGGFLTITAREEFVGGRDYTSSRLITENKADFTYGRMEMRAKMPIGQGLWPAFWMFFTDPSGSVPALGEYGGWAASGEIDIMEYLGNAPEEIFGTIHFGQPFPGNQFDSEFFPNPTNINFNDDFHTFAIEWEPGEIRWYVDNELYATKNTWWSNGGNYPAPFDQDFHLLLNLAVGGNLPGNPDATTVFPQEFVIDYVRVYESLDLPAASITSPVDGASLSAGPLTITADASANLGVASVQFLQGDFVLGEDNTAPYELSLADVAEGPYRIRALVTDTAGNINYSDFVDVTVGSAAQGPYSMEAARIPGMVEAEDFDTGGQGVASNDNDPAANLGSQDFAGIGNIYRNPDGVDLEPTSDAGGGSNVGFTNTGEWLEYTVEVATAGAYDVIARVASEGSGGSFNLEFDGVDKTGAIGFPATGGFQTWVDVVKENIVLDAGVQVMRLNFLASNFNINKLTFVPADPSSGEKVVFADMEHGDPFDGTNGWFTFGGTVGGGGISGNITDLPPLNSGSISLQTGWGSGGVPGFFGGFGRTNPVDISQTTHFNFWINPDAGQDYTLEINLQDDDNADGNPDDEFQYNATISATGPTAISGGGWQLVSIPLTDFFDDNSQLAGNGTLGSTVLNVVLAVISNSGADATFRTDYWSFTNGPLGPEIDVDPLSHDYGDVALASTSAKVFTVTNEGCTDLEITATGITGPDAGEFSIQDGADPFTLGPNQTQNILVRFQPSTLGPKTAILEIASNDADEPVVEVSLTGNGIEGSGINKVVFDDMEHGNPTPDNNGYFKFDGEASPTLAATTTDLPPENGGGFGLDVSVGGGSVGGFLGGFGRTFPVDLTDMTHFNFWINPDAGQDYIIEIQLQDDDNGDDEVPFGSPADDEFQFNFAVNDSGDAIAGGGWQLISLPLSTFFDDPTFFGGNNILDPISTANGGNGQLINVIFGFLTQSSAPISFRTDFWCFSQGPLGVSDPDIAVSPESHDFGLVFQGGSADQAFQVINNGGADLDVSGTTISGPDAADFTITSGAAPFTLGIGESTNVIVTFTSSSLGPKSAVLTIVSNDPDQGSIDIPLTGEGSDLNKVVFDDFEHGDPRGIGWFTFNGPSAGGGIDPNPADLPPTNGGNFSMQTGWGGASPGFYGGFGLVNPKDLTEMTHFNMWINPSPGQEYTLEINLQEDDDGDNAFPFPAPNDDEWQYNLIVGPEGSGAEVIAGGGWQLVSIPFGDFFDDNSIHGGNGVFDPTPVADGGNGQLVGMVIAVIGSSPTAVEFRTDFWCFSEGPVEAKLVFDDMEHGNPFGNGWFAFGGAVGGGGIDPNFTDLPPQQGGSASLQTGWGSGGVPGFLGGFGRTFPTHIADVTHFNMWINPDAGQDYVLEINLQDDDNGDNAFPFPAPDDDEWQYNLQVGGFDKEVVSGGGWQLVSIPLSEFFDDNSIHGGNGVFDPVPVGSGGNGQLINIVAAVISNSGADATFRTDFWCFSDGPADIGCDPEFSVDLGDDQTVYVGYAPAETATISTSVSGGVGPYSYYWSTGESTESISVSPTEATTYYVLVTDALGCTTVGEVQVCTVDVACGNGKVQLCHKGKKTKCVEFLDVANHLGHGDTLGACGTTTPCDEEDAGETLRLAMENPGLNVSEPLDESDLVAYPNPFTSKVTFSFNVQEREHTTLEIFDMNGNKVRTLFNGKARPGQDYQVELDANGLNQGMYIYKFRSGDSEQTQKIFFNKQ